AMRAKFLERIKLFVDLRDRYHLSVNLDAQRFSLAQAVGFRDRHEGKISIVCDIRRGEAKRVFWRRRPPLVPADTYPVVVNETASQITGNGEKRDTDEGQNQGHRLNFWIDQRRGTDTEVDSVERNDNQIQGEMRCCGAFGGMIAANIRVIDEAGHCGDEGGDNSEEHRIKRITDQIWRRWQRETRQIE